ncbi:MAG: aminotransferase class I/II-fold pyridoxal phosphate-dependent enzyme [Proteobacteria bacterium]|nr:aminotransferase class I/II-fold pyridoxal phosphate-dependent enzyme [Pseudomonadota bacterium]
MSDIIFSDRMQHVGYSGSLALIGKVRAMRQQGIEVIDFGQQGPPPKVARVAAQQWIDDPSSAPYTDPRGWLNLRQAIAAKLDAENGIVADVETEIIVTVGGKQALFATLLALVDRGDEVLLEDPGYVSFEPLVRLAGATPVQFPLDKTNGFRFSVDDIRSRVTPRTRVLVLCNPHNPTGRVLSMAELDAVAALAREYDLRVVVDEAYEHFVFDGIPHVSLASLPGMKERTVTVQTMSKVYNMGGWRVGWLAAPSPIAEKVLAVHTHSVTCPASFAQVGAEAAIRARVGEGDLPISAIVEKYAHQRDAMMAGLSAIPGVSCTTPEGAYFVFPDIGSFGLSSGEMSAYLLEAGHVAATPGGAFGARGESHVRVVIKADVVTINRGVERIATALAKLGKR